MEQYYHRELPKIAMGWLGWTEGQALRTDVNSIVLAREGRVAMISAIFAPSDKPAPINARFKDFAKTHNEVVSKTKRRPRDG